MTCRAARVLEESGYMRVPFNYLPQQFNDEETDLILEKVRALVKTGDFTLGVPVVEFEQRLQEMLGVAHVIGTNSGTDALILALKAFGIGRGHEVITQANTFYATAGAIIAVGATPIFVDVDEQYQMDAATVIDGITDATKAIIPVWWTGGPPNWPHLLTLAKEYRLIVIEDASLALGATYDGKPPGSFGHAATFSFHPLKPLNVWGDGGAIATNDEEAATWLRQYRNHGLVNRDEQVRWGINQRLQSIQAVVANHGLAKIPAAIDRRHEIAAMLDKGLSDVSGIAVPSRPENRRSSFQLYMIQADRRDQLLAYLVAHRIEAKIHYPTPLHLQAPARAAGYHEGECPITEAQAGRILTLPCHQFLMDAEVEYMIDQVRRFYA